MKELTAKVLTAGALFIGLGVIACESKKGNNDNYENVTKVTNTEDALYQDNTRLGEADTTTSDSLNNARDNSMTDSTNRIR